MADVPECFCSEEDANSCDWVLEFEFKYSRPSNPDAIKSGVTWKLENIPQALAQMVQQRSINAVNERGAETFIEWMKACFGENDPVVQQVVKTLKL